MHNQGSLKVRQSQRENQYTLGNPLGVENLAKLLLLDSSVKFDTSARLLDSQTRTRD